MLTIAIFLLLDTKLTHQGQLDWKLMELKGHPEVYYWQPVHKDSLFLAPQGQWVELARRARTQVAHSSECPEGMLRVKGEMLAPELLVQLQDKACLDGPRWDPKYLCQHFKTGYLEGRNLPTSPMDFCIDVFEFPNVPGEYPAVMASYNDGKALCEAQGKRLCTEDEWSFACEGEEGNPYPQGVDRYTDPTASFPGNIKNSEGCNYDRLPSKPINARNLLANAKKKEAALELDRSFNGTRAGERKRCESGFGVFDLSGNIEEWTHSSKGRASLIKGGYWAPVRSRCRLSEAAHGPGHKYYQTGFRCCSNL